MESEETAVLAAEMPLSANSFEAETTASETLPPADSSVNSLDESAATIVANESAIRQEWAERIREEKRLPAGLRERLATVVAEAANGLADGQEPRLTVSQVANLFAEALPSFLAATPQVIEHPQGERFFLGEAVTTEEAATIARRQLERTGFQRVS